jgi:hypothetical protein
MEPSTEKVARGRTNPLPPRTRRLAQAAVATLLVSAGLLITGCGGSGGEGLGATATTDSAQNVAPRPGSKAAAPGVPTTRGGDNSIQTWGVEARAAMRVRLAALVKAFLDARAKAEWAAACAYLAADSRQTFERLVAGKSGNAACAQGMKALATGVPASAFVHEAEIEDVLSLRVGGGKAFLIYARTPGEVYATALGREGGAWKVISVGATALS